MTTQRRSTRSWHGHTPLSYYSYDAMYAGRRDRFDSPVGFVLFSIAVLTAIGTIAMAIVGVIALAGGLEPGYSELRYPKPDGYKLEGWRVDGDSTLCIDPRGGPFVDWSLLDMAEDAVATWRAGAPSLPLTISGICKSAGGQADADGQIRWEPLRNLWGQARIHSGAGDIVLSPDISPPSWDCVRNVLLHEIGHVIGLEHQYDDLPSIMNPGGCGHHITVFDVAATQYLYEGHSKK